MLLESCITNKQGLTLWSLPGDQSEAEAPGV